MAKKLDVKIPFNDLIKYVPRKARTPELSSLIDNLFNRFMTHDESIPLFGFIGAKPGSADDKTPKVPQSSVERDINGIIPAISFNVGSEKVVYTVQDILNKAKVLGMSDDLSWLYSQGNNYIPPISIDKFTNFFNYFWTAKAVNAVPDMPWNTELLPEYYTISQPKQTDLTKLNVKVATTEFTVLTGTGFVDQTFVVQFSDATTFSIVPQASLGAYTPVQTTYTLSGINQPVTYSVSGPTGIVNLLQFTIVLDAIYDSNGDFVGYASFEAGDTFTIGTSFLSRNYTLSFVGGTGVKGKITNVSVLNEYQIIDGIQVTSGDRVLVKNNTNIDNGIYIVKPQAWIRATDFDAGTSAAGATVFVKQGSINGSTLWTSFAAPAGGYGWLIVPGVSTSNTNDWQEGNYWVHADDLEALGLTRSDVVQAVRPIIEYNSSVQLNSRINNGKPSDVGTFFRQEKTEFNQLPLFDLYRFDGTHAGLVSSAFFYEEDLTADLDLVLQKRVAISSNSSADFIFNHGMVEADGSLLFVKEAGALKGIWSPGFSEPTIDAANDVLFKGIGNGTITGLQGKDFTQQQVWTLTAITSSTFSVSGSKTVQLPAPYDVATVGVVYDSQDLTFLISSGSIPFEAGDTFTVRVGNIESPRYVYRLPDNSFADLYGKQAADVNHIGAWQVPRTFYNNPYSDSSSPVLEGTLYSHFQGVLSNQLPGKNLNPAFGGSIKLWSEQQTLLASLLMQRDLTPISMIDLAQREYDVALNTVRDIYQQHIVKYLASNGGVFTTAELQKLLDYVLEIRSIDNDVRTVLYDSTAAVLGFPITLPAMGISELIQPGYSLDPVIGSYLLTHHDGHHSKAFIDDYEFRDSIFGNLIGLTVQRSDGTSTPAIGSFTGTPPSNPYQGEFWAPPTGTLYTFDVKSDALQPSSPVDGDYWYQRTSSTLFQWTSSAWVAQPSITAAWKPINLADVLNSLMLLIEQKLYDGINPNARKYDFTAALADPAFNELMKKELFSFAASNGYDPLAPDYVSTNAFTWNYKLGNLGNFPVLSTASVPARWYNILVSHQATVAGVIPTARPNLEPWKLLGFSEFNTWWSSLSSGQQASYTPAGTPGTIDGGTVKVIQTIPGSTSLSGLQTIDGISLQAGDKVLLLQSEISPQNNGIWVVSSGAWVRASNTLSTGLYVTVSEGTYARTVWVLANTPVIGTDAVIFNQHRSWSNALWADIAAARPTLRLSVDTIRDELLPPYVSSTNPQSVNALTTAVPPGIALGYEFGDGGPVEAVWVRSIEYKYSLARSLFRYDALAFIGFCWGFCWVEVDGILYDGFDINMPGPKRFRLHGDEVQTLTRSALLTSGTGTFTLTYDAYDTSRKQNFTARNSTGAVVGYVQEGVPATILGTSFTIKCEGKPFRIGDSFSVLNGVATFIPVNTYKYLGFGQIFTNAIREASIDTGSSYALSAYRGWNVNMSYRAGGLVSTDDLTVYTDSNTLSSASYSLIFKKNELSKDSWLQALRITAVQIGAAVSGSTAGYIPSTDGSDWIFRVEGYNPRYSDIEYYNMDTVNELVTFTALNGAHTSRAWTQPTIQTGTVTGSLPIVITGIQNVVNFLFGYTKYLQDQGWTFNGASDFNIDVATGRVRDWQLEIEKFIDSCYAGIELGQGIIANPFMDKVWFKHDKGLLTKMVDKALFDITAHPGVFDVAGVKYAAPDLNALRTNEISEISAAGPMFSVHAQLDEFEHLFMFNNYVEPSTSNGLLYDPFTGARVITYKFKGRKQASDTMRPEFGGHYVLGNEVLQNIQASTDNIQNYYDANKAFQNEKTSTHALSLLGFNSKDYFSNIDISDKTQFNFWRGLIRSKGTNLSIDAYLNNGRFSDAKIDEYWAYKVAEYGDNRQKTYPELKISVTDSLQQFTQLQFDNSTSQLTNFTQINNFDEARWFSIDDLNKNAFFKAEVTGVYSREFSSTELSVTDTYALPFVADKLIISGPATQVNATTIKVTAPNALVTVTGYGYATPRYNPVKLFNYVASELVLEIPIWHPASGQHNPFALDGVSAITSTDPAKYNYSTLVVNNANYDPLRPWGSNEVGKIWFDTTNLDYIPYYDKTVFSSLDERLSRWGTLADYSTVDVYEWVESTVTPNEYDALSLIDAGNADLDPSKKATGTAGKKETYIRDRLWSIRPIAWSYSPIPIAAAHEDPATFKGQGLGILHVTGNTLWLENDTFAHLSISSGYRVGAFNYDPLVMAPLSEFVVSSDFSKYFTLTGTVTAADGSLTVSSTIGDLTLRASSHTETVGQLLFSSIPCTPIQRVAVDGTLTTVWDIPVQVKVTAEDGAYQIVTLMTVVSSGATSADALATGTVQVSEGDLATFSIDEFGLVINAVLVAGTYLFDTLTSLNAFQTSIVDAFSEVPANHDGSGVKMHDSVTMDVLVQTPSTVVHPETLDNNYDPEDLLVSTSLNGYVGWAKWTIPSQADLSADGKQPNSSYKPFLGEFSTPGSLPLASIQDAISYAASPLTLNDGTVIERYDTTWSDWTVLTDKTLSAINAGSSAADIVVPSTEVIPTSRTSVYVNGLAQLSSAYSIVGTSATVFDVPAGSKVKVIIRKYEPKAAELAFDPSVSDDLTYQQQYKQDYQYVTLPVRDSDGAITSTLYYFWVKNKTTTATGKNLSIQSITQELKDGPNSFLTFQTPASGMLGSGTDSDPYGYDAITISGLNYVVTQNDTFKLRFTRDFTLRDDPEELNLKDTHAEWSLMRFGQTTKIPETLWSKLTDSVSGVDAAGNVIPALRRSMYDERNGTRTQFGFGSEQTLAPKDFLRSTITYTILNTTLVNASGATPVPDYITFLDLNNSDAWFASAAAARQTMTDIWNKATVSQINEIFFAALNEMLACNYELTDIFKTSRLSAYSIKVVTPAPAVQTYE